MKIVTLVREGVGGGAVLALVVAGTALVAIDMTIVSIALPTVSRDLQVGPGAVEWVVVGYLLALGAVTQVAGSLSDRLGGRRVYVTGLVVFALTSLACGLAPTLEVLVGARVGQGVGAAVLMANGLQLLSQRYDGEDRDLAISTWGSATIAAALIAPLLGGLLVDGLGWRALFLVNLPICGAAVIAAGRVLPVDPSPGTTSRSRPDWAGTALLIVALGLLGYGLLRGQQQGWGSAATLGALLGGLGLLLVFLLVERRVAAPVLDAAMFRRTAFAGAALTVFLSRVLSIGGAVYLLRYFQEGLGLSPTSSGLLLAPVFLAQISVGVLGGALLNRFHPGHVIAAGFAAKGVSAAGLALTTTPTTSPWLLVVPLAVWGAGSGIAGAPVVALAMRVTERSHAGMVAGTISTLASIGAGVGTALLGLAYQASAGSSADPTSVSAGTGAVLTGSAGLAVVTTAVVLLMISKRTLAEPPPRTDPVDPARRPD